MDSTLVRAVPGQVIPNSAQGYVPNAAGRYAEVPDLGASRGAGGMYTTAHDLARWMQVYDERGTLVEAMTTPYVTTQGDTTGYGLGLFLGEQRGQRVWEHGGGDTAHRTSFVYYPDLRGGYLIFTNDAAFDATLAEDVAEAFFGEHFEPKPEPEELPTTPLEDYDPADFDELAGRYALDVMPTFVLSFFREGDALYTQATGQMRVPIVPTSDSTFEIKIVEADVVFHRDASGEVTSLTLHQNGQNRATRLPDEDAAAKARDFAEYVGRYYSDELETSYLVEVSSDSTGLVVKQRRFGEVTLAHDEGDSFTGSLPVATADFVRGGGGEVVALVVGNVRTRGVRLERVE
jgi:hypothetical protein